MNPLSIKAFLWDENTFEDKYQSTYSALTFQAYGGRYNRHIRVFGTNDAFYSSINIIPNDDLPEEDELNIYPYRIYIDGGYFEELSNIARKHLVKIDHIYYAKSEKSIDQFFEAVFKKRNTGLK